MVGQKFHLGYLSRCQVGVGNRKEGWWPASRPLVQQSRRRPKVYTIPKQRGGQTNMEACLSWEAAGESTWLHAAEAKIMLCVDRCVLVVVDAVRCSAWTSVGGNVMQSITRFCFKSAKVCFCNDLDVLVCLRLVFCVWWLVLIFDWEKIAESFAFCLLSLLFFFHLWPHVTFSLKRLHVFSSRGKRKSKKVQLYYILHRQLRPCFGSF
jgi:hypothetical protein